MNAGWLTLDTVQWLNAHRVIRPAKDTMLSVNRTAAKCWFAGLLCAVSADLYRLRGVQQRLAVLTKRLDAGDGDAKKDVAVLKQYAFRVVSMGCIWYIELFLL